MAACMLVGILTVFLIREPTVEVAQQTREREAQLAPSLRCGRRARFPEDPPHDEGVLFTHELGVEPAHQVLTFQDREHVVPMPSLGGRNETLESIVEPEEVLETSSVAKHRVEGAQQADAIWSRRGASDSLLEVDDRDRGARLAAPFCG